MSSKQLPVYVINLDRRPERWAAISAQLDGLGLAFERVAAMDANALQDDGAVNRPPFLDMGAKACLMSHRRALSAFLSSDHEAALVLEDDVLLASDMPTLCQSTEWWPDGASLVKLDAPDQRVRRQGWICGRTPSGRDVRAIIHWNWGAGAYLLNREAALAISDAYAKQDMPIDHVMFDMRLSPLARRLRPLQVIPAAVAHPEDHSSDLLEWRDTIPKRRRRRHFLRYRSITWRLRVRWWMLTGRTRRIGIRYWDDPSGARLSGPENPTARP